MYCKTKRGTATKLSDSEANARALSSTLYNWKINDNYACKNEFNLLLLKTCRSLCSWRARQLNLQPHIDDVQMNEQEIVSCICRTQATIPLLSSCRNVLIFGIARPPDRYRSSLHWIKVKTLADVECWETLDGSIDGDEHLLFAFTLCLVEPQEHSTDQRLCGARMAAFNKWWIIWLRSRATRRRLANDEKMAALEGSRSAFGWRWSI